MYKRKKYIFTANPPTINMHTNHVSIYDSRLKSKHFTSVAAWEEAYDKEIERFFPNPAGFDRGLLPLIGLA